MPTKLLFHQRLGCHNICASWIIADLFTSNIIAASQLELHVWTVIVLDIFTGVNYSWPFLSQATNSIGQILWDNTKSKYLFSKIIELVAHVIQNYWPINTRARIPIAGRSQGKSSNWAMNKCLRVPIAVLLSNEYKSKSSHNWKIPGWIPSTLLIPYRLCLYKGQLDNWSFSTIIFWPSLTTHGWNCDQVC